MEIMTLTGLFIPGLSVGLGSWALLERRPIARCSWQSGRSAVTSFPWPLRSTLSQYVTLRLDSVFKSAATLRYIFELSEHFLILSKVTLVYLFGGNIVGTGPNI